MKKKLMLLILLTTFMITACSDIFRSPTCDQPEHNLAGSSSFRLLWSKSNMYVPNTGFHPMIQGLSPHVFVATMPRNGASLITAFDDQSGTILWQRTDKLGIGILASDKSLYVGEVDRIDQYDPETGQLLGEIAFPNVGAIDPMYFFENKIFAMAPRGGRSLTYDVDTKTIDLSRPLLPYTPFVIENGVLYLSDFEGFKAEDINTQEVLWKYSIHPSMNPLFDDNAIIVPTLSDNIYILNKATGELIAKVYARPISNVSQDATRIYFLTEDGALEVMDKASGKEIQKISFSATPFLLSTPEKTLGTYDLWVDPQNEIAVASLGDSCQLVALKLKVP